MQTNIYAHTYTLTYTHAYKNMTPGDYPECEKKKQETTKHNNTLRYVIINGH